MIYWSYIVIILSVEQDSSTREALRMKVCNVYIMYLYDNLF